MAPKVINHPEPPNQGEPQEVRDYADYVLYGRGTQAEAEAEAES